MAVARVHGRGSVATFGCFRYALAQLLRGCNAPDRVSQQAQRTRPQAAPSAALVAGGGERPGRRQALQRGVEEAGVSQVGQAAPRPGGGWQSDGAGEQREWPRGGQAAPSDKARTRAPMNKNGCCGHAFHRSSWRGAAGTPRASTHPECFGAQPLRSAARAHARARTTAAGHAQSGFNLGAFCLAALTQRSHVPAQLTSDQFPGPQFAVHPRGLAPARGGTQHRHGVLWYYEH